MKNYKITKNDIVEFELSQLLPIANDGFGYNHEEFPELEIIVYERWSPKLKCGEPGKCTIKINEWNFLNVKGKKCDGAQVKLATPKVNGAKKLCFPFTDNLDKSKLKELLEENDFF